jgi:RING finger protein 113A
MTDLAGWQLDKLAETAKKDVNDEPDSDSDDEDVPFACLICRKHYTDPVVTRCGHYFCSSCAIKRFAKTPKCLACGAPTGGIFNRADKILEKINKKRKDKEDREAPDDSEAGQNVEIEGLGNDVVDSDSEVSDP